MEDSNITCIKLTRAGFVASGALGIVLTVYETLPTFAEYVTYAAMNFQRGIVPPLVASAFAPFVTLAICWHLIVNSDSMARRLFPNDNPLHTEIESAIYRVAFTSIGLLILVTTLPAFIHAIGYEFVANADSNFWPGDFYDNFTLYNLPHIIAFTLQFAVAIYLIVGAPHLIKWQVSRSANF
jgi:hypothetical protein